MPGCTDFSHPCDVWFWGCWVRLVIAFSRAKAVWHSPPSLAIFKSWVKFELFNPYIGEMSYYNNLSDLKTLCSGSNNPHQHLLTLCHFSLSLQSFLYLAWYTTMSILGHYNNFFFAAHLLDIAMGFKTLRTILSSVTHNGKQVSATCKGLKLNALCKSTGKIFAVLEIMECNYFLSL